VPVISSDTLAQFRGMMPEPAMREIYVAVVADLGKRAQSLRRPLPGATRLKFAALATLSKAAAAWLVPAAARIGGRI